MTRSIEKDTKRGNHALQDKEQSRGEDTSLNKDHLTETKASSVHRGSTPADGYMTLGGTAKRKKPLKAPLISFAVLIALIALLYGAGCFYFTSHFFPNTTIRNNDVSLMSIVESEPILSDIVQGYSLAIDGQGVHKTISSQDIGMTADVEVLAKDIIGQQDIFRWPLKVFDTHDGSELFQVAYDKEATGEVVGAIVSEHNESSIPTVNASISFDESSAQFFIVPESLGTELEYTSVFRVVEEAIGQLEGSLTLTEDELVQPLIAEGNAKLISACNQANEMAKTDLSLMLGEYEAVRIDASQVSQWISFNEELQVVYDEAAFGAWVDDLVTKFNTVGTSRTYTRPDGKVITVEGGSYGWEIDSESLRSQIMEATNAGESGVIEIPIYTQGNGFTEVGGQDWGKRYVDIDLTEQYARFYDYDDSLIWEADVITGAPVSDRITPTGVYYLNNKVSPSVLIGKIDPETNKPKYRSPVDYWMPFVGNLIGLHDATWQPGFGGTMYKDGYGSHGCVNLSLEKAGELYGLIQVGDVVITHY